MEATTEILESSSKNLFELILSTNDKSQRLFRFYWNELILEHCMFAAL